MSSTVESTEEILDRRSSQSSGLLTSSERRQFSGSLEQLSPEGKELGQGIDRHKMANQISIITYDEIITIAQSIGYVKNKISQPIQPQENKSTEGFENRRNEEATSKSNERRQFSSSYDDLSPTGQELGYAVDRYKVRHRRRYITCDEILGVMNSLGYEK